MRLSFLRLALAAGLATAAAIGIGGQRFEVPAAAFPNNDRTVVHVLNRVGFGPRPGDVEKVRSVGLQTFIDLQLRPEWIPDASIEARLSGFSTPHLSSRDIAEQFAQPAIAASRERQKANALSPDATQPAMANGMRPGWPISFWWSSASRRCCAPSTASASYRKC